MMEVRFVSKSYVSKEEFRGQALTNVSLSIGPGEIVGLFGKNGSGKSTLMRCMAGVIRPSCGSVSVDGRETRIGRRVSFAPVEGSCFSARSIGEHRDFLRHMISDFDVERFDRLIGFFGLSWGDRPRALSTGQRSRFEIACTLARQVPYYLFDEPMLGHDIDTRRDFLRLLSGMMDESRSVVLSTHLAEEVEPLLSRVLVLNEGRLASDIPIERIQQEDGSLVRHLLRVGGYDREKVMSLLEPEGI